ncbi:MAG: AAA family ATPase, partial [Beijerinckiaceae bacterium]|nr:AAA family ATPase [Beijerinckiaceae bacterium]
MKFTSLSLEKYGAYENRTLCFRPDARLHLIVGANEAGKTSALSAIGDLLFGFSHAKQFDFRFDAGTLRLGASLQLRDGSAVEFRRRRGQKNVIVDAQDKALGDDFLDPVTGSVSRQVFELEFGLTAERLRAGGEALLAANGSLAESLAAGSAELSALSTLKSELQKTADDLFTSRKVASKGFYVASAEYSDAAKSLQEAIVSVEAVNAAQSLCDTTLAEAAGLEDEHRTITRELARLQRAKRTRGKLQQIAETEEKLAALSGLPEIEPAVLEQWQSAFARQTQVSAQLADAHTRQASVSETLQAQSADPRIAAAASEIEQLREDFGAAEKARSDLPNREKERHATWLQLEAQARDLGLSGPNILLEKMPKRPALARVSALVRNQDRLVTRHEGLLESLANAKKRLVDLQKSETGNVHAADPAPLAQALESFASIPADTRLLRQQQAELDQSLVDLQRRCDRLQPPAPILDDLARLPLPDPSCVDATRREWEETARSRKHLHSQIDDAQTDLADTEKKLARLTSKGAIATRDDLTDRRSERDAALASLEKANDDGARREQALAAMREANLKLDGVTDSLLDDSERAAAKWQLEQELSRAATDIQRLRDLIHTTGAAQDIAGDAWQDLWARSGIEPQTPDTMVTWLSTANDIIDRYDRLSALRT